jgi:hypothetical protein
MKMKMMLQPRITRRKKEKLVPRCQCRGPRHGGEPRVGGRGHVQAQQVLVELGDVVAVAVWIWRRWW